MSRHRDVRCMNYSDEYDGYDDVYGHSVEDDYCVSPGAEQFMYDRNKQANISSFITEPNIAEGNEEEHEDQLASYKTPTLSELDTAKLMSCIDSIRTVIGDTVAESELKKRIIEFDYNTEAVLDAILNSTSSKKTEEQTPNKRPLDFSLDLSLNKSALGSKTELHAFTIPKLTFQKQSKFDQDQTKEHVSMSPLSNLKSLSSLSSSSVLNTKKDSPKFSGFSNLNSLKKNNEAQQCSSLSDLIQGHKKLNLTKLTSDVKSTNPPSFTSLSDLTSHHLSKSSKPFFSLNKEQKVLSLNANKEENPLKNLSNLKNTFSDSIVNIVTKDVSSLTLHEEQNTSSDKKGNMLNNEMEIVVKETENLNLKSPQTLESKNTSKNVIILDSSVSSSCNIHKTKVDIVFKKASPLGKVLCRRWKTKTPFTKSKAWYFQTSPHITRFDFSELSPDSKILQYLRKKV